MHESAGNAKSRAIGAAAEFARKRERMLDV